MSEFHEKLWQVAVTLTAVAAWIGCLVWLVRATKPQADDDCEGIDIPPYADKCLWCPDEPAGQFASGSGTVPLCVWHFQEHLRIEEFEQRNSEF